jgi:hypothetical protein
MWVEITCKKTAQSIPRDGWIKFRWNLRTRWRRCELMDEYGISGVKHSHSAIRIYFHATLTLKTYSIVLASTCSFASRKYTALATENLYLHRNIS